MYGLFLESSSIPLICMSILCQYHIPKFSLLPSFVVQYRIGKCRSLPLLFSFETLAILVSLQFHANLRIGFSISAKKTVDVLMGPPSLFSNNTWLTAFWLSWWSGASMWLVLVGCCNVSGSRKCYGLFIRSFIDRGEPSPTLFPAQSTRDVCRAGTARRGVSTDGLVVNQGHLGPWRLGQTALPAVDCLASDFLHLKRKRFLFRLTCAQFAFSVW